MICIIKYKFFYKYFIFILYWLFHLVDNDNNYVNIATKILF